MFYSIINDATEEMLWWLTWIFTENHQVCETSLIIIFIMTIMCNVQTTFGDKKNPNTQQLVLRLLWTTIVQETQQETNKQSNWHSLEQRPQTTAFNLFNSFLKEPRKKRLHKVVRTKCLIKIKKYIYYPSPPFSGRIFFLSSMGLKQEKYFTIKTNRKKKWNETGVLCPCLKLRFCKERLLICTEVGECLVVVLWTGARLLWLDRHGSEGTGTGGHGGVGRGWMNISTGLRRYCFEASWSSQCSSGSYHVTLPSLEKEKTLWAWGKNYTCKDSWESHVSCLLLIHWLDGVKE